MEESPFYWKNYSDEELLKLRFCELGLNFENSGLKEKTDFLFEELKAKEITEFQPRFYLGDEWFSPEGSLCIAIPFYLAHPRLIQLEKKFMVEVEGESEEWIKKLIRHEAGHCLDHAYRFSKSRKWQKLFGSSDKKYDPEHYKPRPYSRNFVRNLDRFYAQAHPDEDFAETFAVWLNPHSNWQTIYGKWKGALEKLKYIEAITNKIKKTPPLKKDYSQIYSISRMKSSLGKYYQKKIKQNADDLPDFYDADLRKIFSQEDQKKVMSSLSASKWIKKNETAIIHTVSLWSGSHKYPVSQLLKKIKNRCEETKLFVTDDHEKTLSQFYCFITSIVTHYRFTGKFSRNV
jgi:hypothetical protein